MDEREVIASFMDAGLYCFMVIFAIGVFIQGVRNTQQWTAQRFFHVCIMIAMIRMHLLRTFLHF